MNCIIVFTERRAHRGTEKRTPPKPTTAALNCNRRPRTLKEPLDKPRRDITGTGAQDGRADRPGEQPLPRPRARLEETRKAPHTSGQRSLAPPHARPTYTVRPPHRSRNTASTQWHTSQRGSGEGI